MDSEIIRGGRRTARIDFATAKWEINQFGVGVLSLSRDPISGAETFALDCPPDFVYPEEAHFYDCEEELFQFSGEFHHDELVHFNQGDYVYRPIGTVYGHGEGSDDGGIIIASLARERRRYHFQDHPEPWTGHYLVDRLWNPRPVQPLVMNVRDVSWQPDATQPGLALGLLRGVPGRKDPVSGASAHSPWGADAAFVLRLTNEYTGPFPTWPGFMLEVLVIGGRAVVNGESWHRGCYGFDAVTGDCQVDGSVEIFVRCFAELQS